MLSKENQARVYKFQKLFMTVLYITQECPITLRNNNKKDYMKENVFDNFKSLVVGSWIFSELCKLMNAEITLYYLCTKSLQMSLKLFALDFVLNVMLSILLICNGVY